MKLREKPKEKKKSTRVSSSSNPNSGFKQSAASNTCTSAATIDPTLSWKGHGVCILINK